MGVFRGVVVEVPIQFDQNSDQNYPEAVNVRQISISEFKTHCTELLREVERGGLVLKITRHGKVIASAEPHRVSYSESDRSVSNDISSVMEEVLAGPASDRIETRSDVWSAFTAPQLARRQHVAPAADWEALLGDGSAGDWEGFEEALARWREEEIRTDDDAS